MSASMVSGFQAGACIAPEHRVGRVPPPFFVVFTCACKCPITKVSQTKVMFFFKMIKFLS